MLAKRTAFTLVELLVVITIIGILIALLLPAVQAAREAARRMQCSNNLKQIALALANYECSFKVFPPGRLGCDGSTLCPLAPERVGTSGLVMILPYIEQQALYDRFDFKDGPWTYNSTWIDTNDMAIAQRVEAFVCPSDTSKEYAETAEIGGAYSTGGKPVAVGNYALVSGSIGPSTGISTAAKYDNNGVFYYRKAHRVADISDGLSTTMFVGEVIETHTSDSSNIWSRAVRFMDCHRSTDNPLNTPPGDPLAVTAYGFSVNAAFASRHPGGAMFAFGDAHVSFLSENIDLATYRKLSTRNGGLPVSAF